MLTTYNIGEHDMATGGEQVSDQRAVLPDGYPEHLAPDQIFTGDDWGKNKPYLYDHPDQIAYEQAVIEEILGRSVPRPQD